MAAKKTKRPPTDGRAPPDIQEIFALYLQASLRLRRLDAEAADLQAAGKIGQSRQIAAQADKVRRCLTALEREVRPIHPHA